MCTPTSVRVDDNFAAREASIALRAADDELTRWIDVHVRVVTEQTNCSCATLQFDFLQSLLYNFLHDELVHLVHRRGGGIWTRVARNLFAARRLQWFCVLCRDDNGV